MKNEIEITKNKNVFFTADTHFDHENIIKYSNRPFISAAQMTEQMISMWNDRVMPGDIVFILGDVCFGSFSKLQDIIKKLNGTKHLCLGNHDKEITKNYIEATKLFASISRDREISIRLNGAKYNITLNHYAQLVWNKSHHGALHFWGHSHNGIPPHSQGCDVGADSCGYCPTSFEDILKFLEDKPKYPDCYSSILQNEHHQGRTDK